MRLLRDCDFTIGGFVCAAPAAAVGFPSNFQMRLVALVDPAAPPPPGAGPPDELRVNPAFPLAVELLDAALDRPESTGEPEGEE